ncbi:MULTISPECIES: carbohydrate kinase [unclassified Curtobacterium]|uniref:carbohydrate kinase family protein n=1 Tax=unclassified Curtobacterium TaxID=257496 RepID=UPI0008DE51E8|nr:MULTISPECIES: carbohydrate kinase [unclassified Curtobacterium]WIA97098.1 carbohydrate kinase [Curtobacterium sp. MCBA15_004]WIB00426.1 carbohydrate kinase [Curtobacterium sp. MCBA15_012]
MDTVIVIGEALVDVVDRPEGRVEHPGGSPMNVAVGLARLGRPARLVCALGDDARGASVRDHVGASDVQVDATAIDRTSTAVATIGEDGGASYEFDLDWRLDAVDVPAGTPLVHVGSIGAVLQPGAQVVLDAVRSRPTGALVSVDPNVRPTITPDRDGVLATLAPLLAEADVVKCSDEDAAWLWPDRDVDAVLDGLLEHGAGLAAVTLGGSGCAIATARARRTLPAPTVDVADTIGAGDSFMSGLLAGVLATGTAPVDLDEDELGRLAALALACAAVTVSRPGADPPTRDELAADVAATLGERAV